MNLKAQAHPPYRVCMGVMVVRVLPALLMESTSSLQTSSRRLRSLARAPLAPLKASAEGPDVGEGRAAAATGRHSSGAACWGESDTQNSRGARWGRIGVSRCRNLGKMFVLKNQNYCCFLLLLLFLKGQGAVPHYDITCRKCPLSWV